MNNTVEKVQTRYIAVLRYHEGKPIFHKEKQIISASDTASAFTLLDLMGVSHVDVLRYVENDDIYV